MRQFRFTFVPALLGAVSWSCGETLGLPRPNLPNVVDTVALFAVTGTPVSSHSGYRLEFRQTIRIDQASENSSFDFAFDIDTAGRALIMPSGALGLPPASGVQLSTLDFDSIFVAPSRDYLLDSAVEVQIGSVVLLSSRPALCTFGITSPYYGKLQVLDIDTTSAVGGRRVEFQILVDQNCGYRGLEPGLPSR